MNTIKGFYLVLLLLLLFFLVANFCVSRLSLMHPVDYAPITSENLFLRSERYLGKKVSVADRLRVMGILDDNNLQAFSQKYNRGIFITTTASLKEIKENDSVVINSGTITANKCFDNLFGERVCQPSIVSAVIERDNFWNFRLFKKIFGLPL